MTILFFMARQKVSEFVQKLIFLMNIASCRLITIKFDQEIHDGCTYLIFKLFRDIIKKQNSENKY